MRLTDEEIAELQRLYKEKFNIELSREEAVEDGLDLITLVRLTYQPIKKVDVVELDQTKD
ncbi:MAG: hypothetical protein WCG01_00025 [bacterium]